ncbi:phage tail protein [Providencia rettgeri]|uniref:phage tail protein n=1 Tax=Providencia rettgeri TaxID=587 RepID=UPI002053B8AC|nr:phage tail protein [Providencia rettgeri]UPS64404.1 phage tail protein [Providencia rettgeri]
MAKNEFLPFGIAEGANVLSNQEYERLAARFNGFISGVAKSKELNTVWRQSSVMSSALAQFIVDSDNKDLLDNGDVASIKTRLVAAIKQTISGVGYVTTAAMNLELNKKIDKASISGQKGNDNDKVPSLNLFTTEIGKLAALGYSYSKIESDGRYQPKGNYAPADDYATNASLNSGLNEKVNKTNGEILGRLGIKANDDYPYLNLVGASGALTTLQANVSDAANMITIVNRDSAGTAKNSVRIPNRTGITMLVGDYGIGSKVSPIVKGNELVSGIPAQMFRQGGGNNDDTNTFTTWGSGISIPYDATRQYGLFFSGKGNLVQHYASIAGVITRYSLYSTANAVTDRNGNLKVSSSSDELSDYPVGAPIPWPQATAPAGFLVCNGQSFNKTTYPLLAKAYPTGILPDLRGEFLRGLDAGRGVDSGRAVLSAQGDAFRAHNHSVIGEDSGSGTAYFGRGNGSRRGISKDAMNLEGGTETRPRNIAFLYIVRAA